MGKMKRNLFGCGLICVVAFSTSIAAQNAASGPSLPAPAPAAPLTNGVTVEGCVYKEADAPGRQPTSDERSRVVRENNFVLADTAMQAGSAPAGARGPLMYKIKELEKDDLSSHVGHRVQIDGWLDKTGRAKSPVSFAHDLVELRGTTIRMVADTCDNR
jgi:hypothetical protein